MKGTSFLIQALNSYFFLSADGNLYFSEVQQNDEGNYHCIVTLKAFPGDTLATDQPPTETSLDIKLDVLGDSKYSVDCSSQCSCFFKNGGHYFRWYIDTHSKLINFSCCSLPAADTRRFPGSVSEITKTGSENNHWMFSLRKVWHNFFPN